MWYAALMKSLDLIGLNALLDIHFDGMGYPVISSLYKFQNDRSFYVIYMISSNKQFKLFH
jgi:hypothetical protein